MSTLLFCTSYAPTKFIWQARFRRWLDCVLADDLHAQQVLIVDDGSPDLPDWPDVQVVAADDGAAMICVAPIVLAHFPNRLGKGGAHVFPGWFRSLGFAARFAQARGFARIVHLESDAFVLTERMRAWLRTAEPGWHAAWCPKYSMPELAIQKIGADQIATFTAWTRQPYAALAGRVHEALVPLTHVNRTYRGDRFGEAAAPVPRDADFAAQIPAQREGSYYWWTSSQRVTPGASRTWSFAAGGNGRSLLQSGFVCGDDSVALSGAWSSLRLPGDPASRESAVSLVMEFAAPAGGCQTIVVTLNGLFLARFDLDADAVVGVDLPSGILRGDGSNLLTFVRTDDRQRPLATGASALALKRVTLRDQSAAHAPDQ